MKSGALVREKECNFRIMYGHDCGDGELMDSIEYGCVSWFSHL